MQVHYKTGISHKCLSVQFPNIFVQVMPVYMKVSGVRC
ncbi:Uncharacterized protein dnm_082360 [Desulfonema magnum]|uniref:Uncharacterized protein n=1 Tax=Desulfonema magnum TaxID=45655 RepID=A0A975GSK8_9BACT|nr:Uncharacterized protein dnm_082360 [Desulfonema magnum]